MGGFKLFSGKEGILSLKSKPGGTIVGNTLRAFVHKQTDGFFGNGVMMRQEGEDNKSFIQRMLKGIGAGAAAGQDAASPNVQAFKLGVITAKIKEHLPKIIIVAALFAGGIFATKKLRK